MSFNPSGHFRAVIFRWPKLFPFLPSVCVPRDDRRRRSGKTRIGHRDDRHGFTLTELMVAFGIIAILLGLLFPAIQYSRRSAARQGCSNNLRQIGLGLQSFHEQDRVFPPGLQEDQSAPYPLLSWMGRILPFVEEEPLWELTRSAFLSDPYLTANPPHVGESTVLPLFLCPASSVDPTVRQNNGVTLALASYRGVDGTAMTAGDGMLYCGSRVRIADVLDGTSNTLMVGESVAVNDSAFPIGVWYDGLGLIEDTRMYGAPDVVLGVSEVNLAQGGHGSLGGCETGPYAFQEGTVNNPCDTLRFWSQHGNGANFLFVDGSVRFITYEAAAVLPKLGTRAGGEIANPADF